MITKQPKFTLKSKSFDDFRNASENASDAKTINTKDNKDAKGSDRNIKNIIMESVGSKIDALISEGKSEEEIKNLLSI